MKLKKPDRMVFFLFLAVIHASVLQAHASELQELDFEVIAWGDQSGYVEETYFVARTEAEWADIWERHSLVDIPSSPYPEIDFSENMVICAFLGRRPTAGYRVSIEGIWFELDHIRVELVEHNPRNQTLVAQIITQPYLFALLEFSDVPVIFEARVESGMSQQPLIPELYSSTVIATTFLVFSSLLAFLARKARRHKL